MRLAPHYAPFGLRITAGALDLVPVTDEIIPTLVDLALAGIHPPDQMPFQVPWSTAPPEELGANMAQFYWQSRADFSRASWSLNFAVVHEGHVVGCQDLTAQHFGTTRSAETGSWLGAAFQGHGIGTMMRQAMCAFAFDELGAAELTSSAFLDNPASLAVSARLGYRPNGVQRRVRRPGELAHLQRLRLVPRDLVRGEPVTVTGVVALRAMIGS